MKRAAYDDLLKRYLEWAVGHPDVRGLVAVGSTAAVSREPDPWSDHDLIVVTSPGRAAALRADLSWIPDAQRMVLTFAETTHGILLLDDDAHLVELAIFDPDEFDGVAIEDYRVLLDRGGVTRLMLDLQARTATAAGDRVGISTRALALFAKHLVIGVNRYVRGEHLSAHDRVRGEAVRQLLTVASIGGSGFIDPRTCTVDPFRRIEATRPDLARAIAAAVRLPLPETARGLLDLADAEAAVSQSREAKQLLSVLRAFLDTMDSDGSSPTTGSQQGSDGR